MQVRELTDLHGATEGLLRLERDSFPQPWTTADFELLAADDRALNVGLWRGAELTGYVLGYVEEGSRFHLASLAIDPASRRQGWGSRLLCEVLHKAMSRGCRTCLLEVRRSNSAAIALYDRFEFRQTAIVQRFYTSPREDALVMERELESTDPILTHPISR